MTRLILINITFILFGLNVYAQVKTNREIRTYVSLKQYKKKYDISYSDIDKNQIRIRENDTLIWDKNYVRPKGISVPYEYKDETFLNVYKPIAFKIKNDSTGKTYTMKYWKDDISIYFGESISKHNKKNFMRFAKSVLKNVDSLNIKEVKDIKDSNYYLYTSNDYDYEGKMATYTKSDYYMFWNGKSQIYKTALKLFDDVYFNDHLMLNAMKSYFLRSLGHFNFNNNLDCSNFFSGCLKGDIKLSNLDEELIKYHYSYGICKGTDKETFEKNHKNAKDALKKKHQMKFFHPIK